MKTLEILIPTYNRSYHLRKNLIELSQFIKELDCIERVSLFVSNNKSTDDTQDVLSELNIPYLSIHNQNENIGLENNALYCLGASEKDFVMYLGDDDYISKEYLQRVMEIIDEEKELTMITPAFYAIDMEGKALIGGRDLGLQETHFKPSYKAAQYFSFRGHQLSGQVLKRQGLFESYKKNAVNNLYPFIYFATKTAMDGVTVHCPQFPVRVTQITQANKDWEYGEDGLLDNVFNNFKCMSGISYMQRFSLEQVVLKKQDSRYISSFLHAPFDFILAVIKSENTTILTKFSYFYWFSRKFFGKIIRKIYAKK